MATSLHNTPISPHDQPSWLWWLLAAGCVLVAFYALAYVVLGDRIYAEALADSFRARPWGIYPHAFFGMIALAIAPLQFHRGLRTRRPALHRTLGKTYMVCALLTGTAGLYMSIYSFGGMVTHIGFGLLGIGLLLCSILAWQHIRKRRVARHQEWVIRSFALLFSAVTLRLWLPTLIAITSSFNTAYLLVAWVSWVPNVLVAEWWIRHRRVSLARS